MSTSGPLLPTVPQGDPLPSPPPSSQEEEEALVTSPSSATTSPSKVSLFPSEKKDDDQKPPLLEDIGKGEGGTHPKSSHHPTVPERVGKNNGTQRQLLPGKEKSSASRDWSPLLPEMFQDEGWGDGPACVESDDDGPGAYRGCTPPTPPALRAVRWAESLPNLLSDDVGAKTFRSYLQHEQLSPKVLDFWYACKGLKEEEEEAGELVLLIWKSFLRNRAVKVCSATYDAIETRIRRKDLHARIFDQAQAEVEAYINDTLYISFLKSDFYLSVLQPWKREGAESPTSPPLPSEGCCPFTPYNYLPTLHEDAEYDIRGKAPPPARLTSNNLLASANYRANIERIKPEANAGFYLRGSTSYNPSPYHVTYVSGHAVSLQDSELQSLSSGAHTDDTKSGTNSSVDARSYSSGHPLTRKQLRRQNQRMKENALQNRDPPLVSTGGAGVHVIPRTMLGTQTNFPRADREPVEFARVLCEKLERSQQSLESRERLFQSMCKITHSEDAPEEARREHAVNAVPPNVLLYKLNERVQLDDQGLSQSILDEHVARVWDSPICSPSSPKATCGGETPPNKERQGGGTRQLPHLSYPHPVSVSDLTSHLAKCAMKASRHHANVHSAPSSSHPSAPQSVVGARGRYPTTQGVGGGGYGGHLPHGYQQQKNGYHARRRERGQDVYSTFSSDSGNVADYHDGQERLQPSHLPKSRSMPEYIENHAVGGTSDTASSTGRRHPSSGNRRCCRRPPADCTDSGVSVVSDSGRSGAALSTSSDRVESWLFQSRPFTCGGNASSHSVCPGGNRETPKEILKARGPRSTHTLAGSTSPGMQRKGAGSSGRRSQCSSSTSGNTCVMGLGPGGRPYEGARDSPVGQAQPCVVSDRRKAKGGSSSSKSTGPSSSVGDGSGSNGSTMKKAHKASKQGGDLPSPPPPAPSSGPQGGTPAPPSGSSDVTTIVYSFHDDHVPFIIKVPSRPVTLKKFKQHLHKKGLFRYFFKKFCEEMGMVYEEITDDGELLPLFEGKVFVQIHKDD